MKTFFAAFAFCALASSLCSAQETSNKAASNFRNCGCQCISLTFLDDDGYTQGNCKSTDKTGARWCYIDSSSTCRDPTWSSRFKRNWSYEACGTPKCGKANEFNSNSGYNSNSNNGFSNSNNGYNSNGFSNSNNGYNNNNNNNGFSNSNNGFSNSNNGYNNNNNGFSGSSNGILGQILSGSLGNNNNRRRNNNNRRRNNNNNRRRNNYNNNANTRANSDGITFQ